MAYEIRAKRKGKDDRESFSFPSSCAQLSESVIKSSKIAPALNRIGKQLIKQFANSNKKVVGIQFHDVTFTFIFKKGESHDRS